MRVNVSVRARLRAGARRALPLRDGAGKMLC